MNPQQPEHLQILPTRLPFPRFLKAHILVVLLSLGLWMTGLCLSPLFAGDPTSERLQFFEQKIRPVLVQNCYECHSAKSKLLQAELRVDSREGLLTGGASGPAIVPGKPGESLLLETLRYTGDSYDMPPKGKLPDRIIADFEKWIADGAADPRNDPGPGIARAGIDLEAGRQFWSLQRPHSSSVPIVKQTDWPRQKLDAFILAALEKEELSPSIPTDRRTLIRRACLDLTGLPPSYDEIEQFAGDPDPRAYESLIDRLLDSPHYGERWARHWLDVVRYAEDNVNMGPHNGPYKNAYRYRDWVIQALNNDLPYDEFIRRQLAADMIPGTDVADRAALGLLGLSPQYHKELLLSRESLESVQADEWEDRVDLIGRGLLGLTIACARCHDHKYDPITTKDYYALAGVFASIRQTTRPIIPDADVVRSAPAREEAEKLRGEIQTLKTEISKYRKAHPAESKAKTPPAEIAFRNQQINEKQARIDQLAAMTPNFDLPVADCVTEEQVRFEREDSKRQKFVYYKEPRNLPVFIRGNITNPGEVVPRRFLEVLSPEKPVLFQQGSGRLELARAIASRENPLTARVFVNRVWMFHFGQGFVDTPSNFGFTGSPPSHPELLDDLAVDFMNNGWSLKWLHRQIMLSATYRQSSRVTLTPRQQERDPGNRLLGHFPRQRLDAETFHDAFLVAGGNLDLQMRGPSANIDESQFHRRAIYATISRNHPSQYLQVNDFPDPTIHAEQRALTTTPLQQLYILNSPFVKQQARALAARIPAGSLSERMTAVHRLVFGRNPTPRELQLGKEYVLRSADENPLMPGENSPLAFNGSRMKARVPHLGDVYTVEIWFRNTVPYAERPITGYLFSRGADGSKTADGDHLGIGGTSRSGSGGRLLFFNGNRLRNAVHGKTVLEFDHWHHVALVRDREQVRVYLDGNPEPEISATVPLSYDPQGEDLFLGGRNDRFANFRGEMGGVSLYQRPLSGSEIASHFHFGETAAGVPLHQQITRLALKSAPVSFWALFQTSANNSPIPDLTMQGHDGIYDPPKTAPPADHSLALTPWELYCHALLCSNELAYVD